MLQFKELFKLNKYGQDLIERDCFFDTFVDFNSEEKNKYLRELVFLISQSKPQNKDIESAIVKSALKATFTPCVLLKKGVLTSNLLRIVDLPDSESVKVLFLLLELFNISYKRRFNEEKNNPDKWWYWDLSDEDNVLKVCNKYSF